MLHIAFVHTWYTGIHLKATRTLCLLIEGDGNVNVHMSKSVWMKVINNMVDEPVLTYSFSKKDMAETKYPPGH